MTPTGGAHTPPQPAPPQKKGRKERWNSFFHREPSGDVPPEANVQVFASVGWIDRRQLWIFEMVSSLAVILLAFGLVTSQTNVQTHGAILSNHPWMQEVWAWTQNIAIDMSLLGAIIRCTVYGLEREHVKAVLYGLLALLLLFTAFIVSDVEAIYQSLHGVTLETAWSHLPLVNVELLTSIRSFAIVLLLVAHAVQYINWYRAAYRAKRPSSITTSAQTATAQPGAASTGPMHHQREGSDLEKLLQAIQTMNQQNLAAMQAMNQQAMQVTIEQVTRVTIEAVRDTVEQVVTALPSASAPVALPTATPSPLEAPTKTREGELPEGQASDVMPAEKPERGETSELHYGERIEALFLANPAITIPEIEQQIGCSRSTAQKWLKRVKPVVE